MEEVTDYRKVFSTPMTRLLLNEVVDDIIRLHPKDFDCIYTLIADPKRELSWRAAWACQKIVEQDPTFLNGKLDEILSFAMETPHSGSRRILLSILLDHLPPTPLPIPFLDYCFNHMLDPNEAIAVQALCIKLAYKLCVAEPDLLIELGLYLDSANSDYYSPAVRSCVKNIRKKIK